MFSFPFAVRWLLPLLLGWAVHSWGQAIPASLTQLLRHYQLTPAARLVPRRVLGYRGTVQLPPEGTQFRTGTIDSDRGELHLQKLLIHYDLGMMGGIHVGPHHRGGNRYPGANPAPFSTYEERLVGPLQATLGLRPSPQGTEVVATLRSSSTIPNPQPDAFPANFWAIVHTKTELQQFLAVVFSYRPVTKP